MEAQAFDYLRITFHDFHGIARGKVVPRRNIDVYIKDGLYIYATFAAVGPRTQVPEIAESVKQFNHGNARYELLLDTLYEVPWAGKGKKRVGEVLCEPVLDDGTRLPFAPRYVAQKQLETLDKMGYKIWSACEVEGLITHADTQKPLFDGKDFAMHEVFGQFEGFLFEVDSMLEKAGVNVSAMHTEWGPGQFEWNLEPYWGIDMADKTIRLRQAIREISREHGYQCWFASKPFKESSPNGCHFNHSLWDKQGKNAFLDEEAENRFSALGRHWLGGLIKHAGAICALTAPTVNCYRRYNGPFAPSTIYWDYDDRLSAFRVPSTNKTSKGPFIENRLGSGCCNPYFLLAATVAAGIDGIKNCIEPLARGPGEQNPKTPRTLTDALNALEEDKVICEALGEQFVRWFLIVKRDVELKELADSDVAKLDEAALAKERDMYKYI